MTDFSNTEEQQRLQSYLKVHLKKDSLSQSKEEQIKALQDRDKKRWLMLGVNILAILVFGYSFYYDITDLSQTFFIIIAVVFGVNVGLIFYQKKQISELIEYLRWKQRHES